VHDRFSITRHLVCAEARLILCNLLLAFFMLAPEYSDACSPYGESALLVNGVGPDLGETGSSGRHCRIEVTGTNHRWQARYEYTAGRWSQGGDQTFGEPIHVPCGAAIVIVLKSTDFVYLFAVPQLGLREIAVPDLEFRIEFRPSEVGRFSIVGQRLCAESPAILPAELVVESPEEFSAWLRETTLQQKKCAL
jgi:heme/copper-type cytochrome/quinol oxidase subunit 2